MMDHDQKNYEDVCSEMADQTLALASRVAAGAVKRGISYRLACHAVQVALYQGVFGATLRQMKNDRDMPSSLSMEEAFAAPSHHESVAHEIGRLILDHLKVVDHRYVWAMNIVKMKARSDGKKG